MFKKIAGMTLLALGFAAPAHAVIVGMNQLVVDLTKPEEAKAKAKWSDPNKVALSTQGLGWGTAGEAGTKDFWLQTTEPLALGTSWRPTSAANLKVVVKE